MSVLTPIDVGPEVIESGNVLVVITSLHCKPCKVMKPWLEDLADEFGDSAKVVVVTHGVDPEFMRYAKGVKSLTGWPYTIIYKDGVMAGAFFGFQTEEHYKCHIRSVMEI